LLEANQSQSFSGLVAGAKGDLTWSISPAVGTLSGSTYSAPSFISSAQVVTIKATDSSNSTVSGSATILLLPQWPGSVIVTPSSSVLYAGQTAQLTTSMRADLTLLPGVGTIDSDGLYTAPPTITSVQAVTVLATAKVNSALLGVALITLMPGTPS
jgi:hypothetical protein